MNSGKFTSLGSSRLLKNKLEIVGPYNWKIQSKMSNCMSYEVSQFWITVPSRYGPGIRWLTFSNKMTSLRMLCSSRKRFWIGGWQFVYCFQRIKRIRRSPVEKYFLKRGKFICLWTYLFKIRVPRRDIWIWQHVH